MAQLSINIDHIATLREARKDGYPDPVEFALLGESTGCHGITVHLREDRRHIQDADVFRLQKLLSIPLNLELSLASDMRDIALEIKPYQVTFVPEKREELTTEGGLDLRKYPDIQEIIRPFFDKGILVSFFVDPDPEQLKIASQIKASSIELHTGNYANAQDISQKKEELLSLQKAISTAVDYDLRVHAGHGLDYNNIYDLVAFQEIAEFSIGFAIVAESLKVGFASAIKRMLDIVGEGR